MFVVSTGRFTCVRTRLFTVVHAVFISLAVNILRQLADVTFQYVLVSFRNLATQFGILSILRTLDNQTLLLHLVVVLIKSIGF